MTQYELLSNGSEETHRPRRGRRGLAPLPGAGGAARPRPPHKVSQVAAPGRRAAAAGRACAARDPPPAGSSRRRRRPLPRGAPPPAAQGRRARPPPPAAASCSPGSPMAGGGEGPAAAAAAGWKVPAAPRPARARGGRRAAPPHAPSRRHFLPRAGNPRRRRRAPGARAPARCQGPSPPPALATAPPAPPPPRPAFRVGSCAGRARSRAAPRASLLRVTCPHARVAHRDAPDVLKACCPHARTPAPGHRPRARGPPARGAAALPPLLLHAGQDSGLAECAPWASPTPRSCVSVRRGQGPPVPEAIEDPPSPQYCLVGFGKMGLGEGLALEAAGQLTSQAITGIDQCTWLTCVEAGSPASPRMAAPWNVPESQIG
ncbi:transcription initiation factor TFIID subunit 4-like [Sciurus carolinensis]|uniref:transcription initiation factor TFIID subunit 4-like n=1 Tax=Sciurus carolinensis TaxID=30640 RepID=UPI001FB2ECB2|nr:transcription initiation factor TFIID subunit 4-like [Sciurus carolinensis]